MSDIKNLISDDIKELIAKSSVIDPDVKEITQMLVNGFNLHFDSLSKGNTEEDRDAINSNIILIKKFENEKFKSKFGNNLKAVSEFCSFYSWPYMMDDAPPTYCGIINDATIFYLNKIRVQYKASDQNQISWCNSITSISKKLLVYIKSNYPKGIGAPTQSSTSSQGGLNPTISSKPMSALNSSLQCGLGITSGLKKVTDNMKTHKNPELRTNVGKTDKRPSSVVSAPSAKKINAPIFSLEGNKWNVENQIETENIVIKNAEKNHVISMWNCVKSKMTVDDKVNTISMACLKKCVVVINSVISSIEITNCSDVKLQVRGKCPSIVIDNSHVVAIMVDKENYDFTEYHFANYSSIVIQVIDAEGDLEEIPVLEQIKGKVKPKGDSYELDLSFVIS